MASAIIAAAVFAVSFMTVIAAYPADTYAANLIAEIIWHDEVVASYYSNDFEQAWSDGVNRGTKEDPATIKLYAHWFGCRITVPENRGVILDLNGCVLYRDLKESVDNGEVVYVDDNAYLKVTDSSPETPNSLDIYEYADDDERWYPGNNRFKFSGGGIAGGFSEDDGGGVYVDTGATFIMQGGNIIFNACEDRGGAIYYRGAQLILDDVNITYNRAEDGGGIYSNGDGMTVSNCTFEKNSSYDNGGACYINSSTGDHVFIGSSIIGNFAGEDGGGICINDDGVSLLDTYISGNTAVEDGGGVYVDSRYDLSVQGCVCIDGNASQSTENANLCLQEGLFTQARLYSGGLYEGSMIALNKTGSNGGEELAIGVTEYEFKHYFETNEGSLTFKTTKTENGVYMASVFSNGVVYNIIILATILVVMLIIGLLLYRKGRISKA